MIKPLLYSQRQFSNIRSTINKIVSNLVSTAMWKSHATDPNDKKWGVKDVVSIGTPAIELALESVEDAVEKELSSRQKYAIITGRNKTLNSLYDKFKDNSEIGIVDEKVQAKYYQQLMDLTYQTIKFTKINAKKNVDYNALESHIIPYITLLGTIGLKGVFFLPGMSVGPDRRDFEIVFDPTRLDGRGLEKDPYRNVIYKYKWPVHGFEVPYGKCRFDVDQFIRSVNKFLSLNPKYLCIRV